MWIRTYAPIVLCSTGKLATDYAMTVVVVIELISSLWAGSECDSLLCIYRFTCLIKLTRCIHYTLIVVGL